MNKMFVLFLFILLGFAQTFAKGPISKTDVQSVYSWPQEEFFAIRPDLEESKKQQLHQLIEKLRHEFVHQSVALWPKSFLVKKVSEDKNLEQIFTSALQHLSSSKVAKQLLQINPLRSQNFYFIFTEENDFPIDSWSYTFSEKTFIVFTKKTFNDSHLLRCLAHELAILSDQGPAIIDGEYKKANLAYQNTLKIKDQQQILSALQRKIFLSHPTAQTVLSMIRAFKTEELILGQMHIQPDTSFLQIQSCAENFLKASRVYHRISSHLQVDPLQFLHFGFVRELILDLQKFDFDGRKEIANIFDQALDLFFQIKFADENVSTNSVNYCELLSQPLWGKMLPSLYSQGPRGNVGGGTGFSETVTDEASYFKTQILKDFESVRNSTAVSDSVKSIQLSDYLDSFSEKKK